MKSEEEIIKLTVDCFIKNEKLTESDKHRYEQEWFECINIKW